MYQMPCRAQSKQSDTVSILFSSGTTGKQKGVALTHLSYIAAVSGQMACDGAPHLTRMLTVLPMYHAYGFSVCILSPLARGISVAILKKFQVETLLAAVEKYRVTHMCSVPPIVRALLHADEERRKYELGSWVQLACGAAPLGVETIGAFNRKFPNVKFKQVCDFFHVSFWHGVFLWSEICCLVFLPPVNLSFLSNFCVDCWFKDFSIDPYFSSINSYGSTRSYVVIAICVVVLVSVFIMITGNLNGSDDGRFDWTNGNHEFWTFFFEFGSWIHRCS